MRIPVVLVAGLFFLACGADEDADPKDPHFGAPEDPATVDASTDHEEDLVHEHEPDIEHEHEEDVQPQPGPLPIAQIDCAYVSSTGAPLDASDWEPDGQIRCSAEGSTDPEGLALQHFFWEFDHDQGELKKRTTEPETSAGLTLPGTYRISVRVENAAGRLSEPVETSIALASDAALVMMLTWDHEFEGYTSLVYPQRGGCGADLDFHLMEDGGTWYGARAVNWQNPQRRWSQATATLNLDVLSGIGPEVLSIVNPVQGARYRVAAHVFNDKGYGPVVATVDVYAHGELIATHQASLEHANAWWDALEIEWHPTEPIVTAIDEVYTSMCDSPFASTEGCRDRGNSSTGPACH